MSHNLNEVNNSQNKSDAIGRISSFLLFRNLADNYNQIKNGDEATRRGVKKYGIISLILSSIALIISGSCLITALINVTFQGVSLALIMIVTILGGIIIPIILAVYAFVFAVLQVRLNRKAIGIIGIILSILAIVACIALIVLLII